ncbi:methionine aminotransferase [Flavipsychrobacter stenotrophus]|uniref:Methionine aminotransferase n=1 Tax=Flavipsychrobacter stenotrophus TaxID=2077091 RepID=A0A2S7SVI6_9BACT|nr:methionine aminotransferase [Flavipsychrobacter stenotrophus]PQJ10631.1 methionine aminotransferase [Flavipsychrobacter stenotrophus]
MIQLPQKHASTGTSIFAIMSGLAQQHGAINLSQGFPDFQIDEQLSTFLEEGVRLGFNQYAPMPGLPMLRQAIADDFKRRYAVDIDADNEITISPGATYGIYTAFTAILQPGDEAIVFEPAYDSYIPNIEMNGARAVPIPLTAPDFTVDWNRVKAAITPRTKAIILNTPHNPTGTIWSKADWDTLAEIVRDTDIAILSDEVYEQLVYDGATHYSVLQHPELRQRSFAIYSFGKAHNNTGWKMGYCIAPPTFTQAYRRLHQFTSFSVNTPAQYAIAKHISSGTASPVRAIMEAKRNHFLSLLKNTPFTIHKPAQGSYFQLATYESISDKGDLEFAQWLTKEHGVATIPVSAFYHNRHDDKIIRFCFAKKEETLEKAIEQLSRL